MHATPAARDEQRSPTHQYRLGFAVLLNGGNLARHGKDRLHSALGYRSPLEFQTAFTQNKAR